MDNILHLQMGSGNFRSEFRKRNSTPKDIGNNLFHSMLTQKENFSGQKSFGVSLFMNKGSTKSGLFVGGTDGKSDPIRKLDEVIRHLGFLHTQIQLPDSAMPQIVSLLKGQGFSTEKINQLILSSKDKDGFLDLDKLLARLMDSCNVLNNGEKIEGTILTGQVPNVEDILFKMGFGAGEVKTAIEKSINQKGELLLGKLSAEIERFFPESGDRPDLLTMMEQNGINLKHQIPDRQELASSLKAKLIGILQLPPQDLQKIFKQNMASLLREKGMPPEEVKSFLENIEVNLPGTKSKVARTMDFEQGKILTLALLKNNPGSGKQDWNQRILTILRNEKIVTEQDGDLFTPVKKRGVNPANLPVYGGQKKVHAEPSTKVYGNDPQSPGEKMVIRMDRHNQYLHIEEMKGTDHGLQREGQFQWKKTVTQTVKDVQNIQIKEPTGDQHFQKISKDVQVPDVTNQAKNPLNMPQPLPKILDRMVLMIRAGELISRMVIHPPELGRLDLSIAIKNGHLQANLNAESPMVKEIIEANLNHLKQQLTDQGLIVEKFEVMVGLNDKQFRDETPWDWKGRKTPSQRGKADIEEDEDRVIKGAAGYFTDNPNKIDVLV
ncbi:MAG: flagellar hook-length control protein FliK [Deltaproteobacteria bacterium]|nr:flagellar hook-length control protein FliK [Deltaproteobacteria bacterium]